MNLKTKKIIQLIFELIILAVMVYWIVWKVLKASNLIGP